MKRHRASRVSCSGHDISKQSLYSGVTLEGTVIHRSGLITGGQGSSSSRKFDDSEVDREFQTASSSSSC
jgi:structural maintenance of chromosome 1